MTIILSYPSHSQHSQTQLDSFLSSEKADSTKGQAFPGHIQNKARRHLGEILGDQWQPQLSIPWSLLNPFLALLSTSLATIKKERGGV